ncbi:TRAP transporter permease [Alloalcanivorax xenomutans]|uniref:TRAP transporter permease n=1 Tax=Alloalcanivorax xenomutans TaxID=1094342 RepID=UPI0011A46765|nr:TRAP transporter fused permease subunit [Alloalcanivorax xenomutans]
MFAASVRQIGLAMGIILSLVTLYTSLTGIFDPSYQRPLTFAACILVAVLVKPLASRYPDGSRSLKALCWLVDALLLGLILLAVQRFVAQSAGMENMLVNYSFADQCIALAGLIALVELTRREFGLGLSLFAGITLLYCLFGHYLPMGLPESGFTLDQVMQGTWYGFTGVFGQPVAVMISLLYIYIIFGVILEFTGAGPALVRMAIRATGWLPGGPAHAAIFASMLFGTMSGSVAANVAGTGAFTIPMIKRRGFSPAFAGAVEAAASTGGQVIPPVMGAAAFMMAQLTGTPYLLICLAALLPAFFYVAALFVAVYYEARRLGIKPTPKDELPELTRSDWYRSLMFVVPVLTVIGVLASGRSPAMAGGLATVSALIFGFINPEIRRAPHKLIGALAHGGVAGARIMIAIGAIGIVIAGMDLTGLGLSFAQSVASLGDSSLFLSLLLTAAGCLVLGMGMPTLPAYLIIILVMGPALESFDVPVIAAHLFVFYFGVLSANTPPVAIAAFAAAPLAGANPVHISLVSIRLCLVGFIVPFLFVFNPSLLLINAHFDPMELALGVARILLVIWALTTGLAGFGAVRLSTLGRAFRICLAILLMAKGTWFAYAGFALAIGTLLAGWCWPRQSRAEKNGVTLGVHKQGS